MLTSADGHSRRAGTPLLTDVQTPKPVFYDEVATNVTLVGDAFFTSVQCQVNGTAMPTYYINQTTALCTIPPSPNNLYSVVASNDGFHNSSNAVTVLVLGPPVCESVADPYTVLANAALALPVAGRKFSVLGGGPVCLVDGWLRATATMVNTSFVRCGALTLAAGAHNVSVSNDGSLFSNTIWFTAYRTFLGWR